MGAENTSVGQSLLTPPATKQTASGRWRAIASAVGAVMSAPPSQWSRRLAEALGSQSPDFLRARELLQHGSSIADFMETPAAASVMAGPRLEPGAEVAGRYVIDECLGSGAMGEVYQAFDRDVGERIALKLIRADCAPDPSSLGRFRRELKLGRQIRHRSVCQLHDLASAQQPDGSSLVFFTMELLRGETLDCAIRRRKRYTEAETAEIAAQLLDGLAAAHAQGILHGDFKCSNIILKDVQEGGQPPLAVITDFGLARRLGPSPLDSVHLADDKAIMGTPAYMAPEQIQGKRLTETADIHAFGVVLFRMVTGRLPFEGPSVSETVAQRLHGDAPRAGTYAPELSPRWDRVISACLERDPALRPRNVAAVRQLLAAPPPAAWRRPLIVASSVVLTVGMLGGAWNASKAAPDSPTLLAHLRLGDEFLTRRGPGDFQQAIGEFRQALALDARKTAGWVGLADAYAGAVNWGVMDVREGLAEARTAIGRAVQLAPNDARVQALLGYITSIDVERWRTAEPYFRRALQLDAADDKAQFWYATHLGRLGRQSEAIDLLTRVLLATPQSFSVQHQLAMEFYRSGRTAEFLSHARQLVRIQPNLPNSRLTLARALIQTGEFPAAAAECQQAATFGADRGQLLAVLAVLQHRTGDLEAALQSRRELEALWAARPVDTNGVAAAFAVAGDAAAAVKYLNGGFERGDSSVLAAHVTPWFAAVAADPGFVAFLRRIGVR